MGSVVKQLTRPYLLPQEGTIKAGEWVTPDGRALPERLLDWDPATPFEAIREVAVDFERLIGECQLGLGATLAVTSEIRSDRTTLRVLGDTITVTADSSADVQSVLAVSGSALGGLVKLSTTLTLVSSGDSGPLAASRVGSELWRSHTFGCALEGGAARFPTSAVSFSKSPLLDDKGAWSLDWQIQSLDEPVLASVRLLINTDNPRVREAIITGSTAPDSEVIRSMISFDVARTLITSALRSDEFLARYESFPEGSVGRAIAELIQTHWGESPGSLAQRLSIRPNRFEAEIQARFAPVDGEA
ncbi:MAG: hypothetical protein NTY57_08360 [Solirubrobacterales bacterium]|nr:hypothetical protein [Solirubrobacterales bacterium]